MFRCGSLELVMSAVVVAAPSIANMEEFKTWNPVLKVKREEFQRQTAEMTPDEVKALSLRGYFGEVHMRQLWQDFNRKVAPSVSDATKGILDEAKKPAKTSTVKNRNLVKNTILTLSLCLPKDKWEEHCVQYGESIADTRVKGEKFQWIFHGEMERTHGKKELKQLVALKLYEREEVRPGLVRYRKTVQHGDSTTTHVKKLTITKKSDLDEQEASSLFDMLLQRAHTVHDQASSSFSGGGGASKIGTLCDHDQIGKPCSDDEVKDDEEEEEEEEEAADDGDSGTTDKQASAKKISLAFTKKLTYRQTKLMSRAQELLGIESAKSLHEAITEAIADLDALLMKCKNLSAMKACNIDVKVAAKLSSLAIRVWKTRGDTRRTRGHTLRRSQRPIRRPRARRARRPRRPRARRPCFRRKQTKGKVKGKSRRRPRNVVANRRRRSRRRQKAVAKSVNRFQLQLQLQLMQIDEAPLP